MLLNDRDLQDRPGQFRLIPTAWLRQWALGIKDDVPILNISGNTTAVEPEKKRTTVADLCKSSEFISDGGAGTGDTALKMEVIDVVDSSEDEMLTDARGSRTEIKEPPLSEEVPVQDLFEEPLSIVPYLCPHGALNPLKVREFKFVSDRAYSTLLSVLKAPLDKELSRQNALCAVCCEEEMQDIERDRENAEIDERILIALESDLGSEATENSYRISKEWVSSFKKSAEQRRRLLDVKEQALDASLVQSSDGKKMTDFWCKEGIAAYDEIDVNRSLICQHTDIKTDFKRKSIAVTDDDWGVIAQKFNGSTIIRSGSQVCAKCACVSKETQELKQLQRDERLLETSKKCLQDLYVRKQAYPNEISDMLSLINAETGSLRRKVKSLMHGNGEARYLISYELLLLILTVVLSLAEWCSI
jgi:hypothetical protein